MNNNATPNEWVRVPVAHLIIGEPEQTTEGWEHGEWDIEYEDKAIERLAVLGSGSYPLYTAPPTPDVSGLVEALEKIAAFVPKDDRPLAGNQDWNRAGEYAAGIAREALAAHNREGK